MTEKSAKPQPAKFRPVLTENHICHIIALCMNDLENPLSKDVVRVLTPFHAKINVDAIKPAYVLSPHLTLADKMGLDDDVIASAEKTLLQNLGVIPPGPENISNLPVMHTGNSDSSNSES
jgi:hypothetical protein